MMTVMTLHDPFSIGIDTVNSHHKRALAEVGLDPDKIENVLSYGNEHTVLSYDKDWVVKVPRYRPLHSILPVEQLAQNLDQLSQRLGGFLPEVIIHHGNDGRYVIQQERIRKFRPLTPGMSAVLRSQFMSMLSTNAEMIDTDRQSLDFFGSDGLASASKALIGLHRSEHVHMTNIVVAQHHDREQLLIMDTSLLHLTLPARKPELMTRWLSDIVSYQSNLSFLRRWYPLSAELRYRYQLI